MCLGQTLPVLWLQNTINFFYCLNDIPKQDHLPSYITISADRGKTTRTKPIPWWIFRLFLFFARFPSNVMLSCAAIYFTSLTCSSCSWCIWMQLFFVFVCFFSEFRLRPLRCNDCLTTTAHWSAISVSGLITFPVVFVFWLIFFSRFLQQRLTEERQHIWSCVENNW